MIRKGLQVRFSELRVCGGALRSRKLVFPVLEGLRPSTSLNRERLFNWLSSRASLDSTRVLDAFCGSGILGVEALSRGSAFVDFVDHSELALRTLRPQLQQFSLPETSYGLHARSFSAWSASHEAGAYDLLMFDPPFSEPGLWGGVFAWLEGARGWVYLECSPKASLAGFDPQKWEIHAESVRSGVRTLLLRRAG